MTVCPVTCTPGHRRCKSSSPSRSFCPKSKRMVTNRCTYSKAVSAAQGRSLWARERVKAHTKRCREHVTRRNLQRGTQKSDSDTADDSSSVTRSHEQLTVADKLHVGELTVDTALVGTGSTPKSSPASLSDVSVTLLVRSATDLSVTVRLICHTALQELLFATAC